MADVFKKKAAFRDSTWKVMYLSLRETGSAKSVAGAKNGSTSFDATTQGNRIAYRKPG